MDQRHEHPLLHPVQFPHRLLHLGISSLITHPPDAVVDPLGGMALFLREGFVFFDDLSDPLKLGADPRLGGGVPSDDTRAARNASISSLTHSSLSLHVAESLAC